MGMDVSGRAPTSEVGTYFRNNVWWWRPLWEYCEHVAPELTRQVKYGYSNDGDGLDAVGSRALAAKLQAEIDSGRCAAYAQARDIVLANLPDEDCDICGGTGKRQAPPASGPGDLPCNGCQDDSQGFSTGKRRPWDVHYPFDVDNVQKFTLFLRDSGGFSIY